MTCQFKYFAVQERHAQLQAVGHAHAVGFQQDIIQHPGVHIHPLQLGGFIQTLHFIKIRLKELFRAGAVVVLFQAAVTFSRVQENIVGAHIALPGFFCTAHQEVLALKVRQFGCHCACGLTQRFGHLMLVIHKVNRLAVHGVAAKQFIGTFAGKHDLDVLAGVLGQKVKRNFRRVGHGFIQVPLDQAVGFKELFGIHLIGNAGHTDFLTELLGIRQLGVFFLRIADREALDMRSTLSNLVDHKAGIHTGRKEAANLNIGNLVGGNAFGKGIGDDFFPLFQALGIVHMVLDLIVAFHCQLAIFPGEHTSAGQLVDIFEHGFLIGDILNAQIFRQAFLV